MDFSFSEQEELFKRAVRDFSGKELAPRAAEIDTQASFPADLLPKMGDLGVFGILLPCSFDGSDAGMLSYLLAVEEISAACASTGFTVVVSASLAFAVNAFGNEELKSKVLPRMASGQAMGSVAISEPFAGEDIAAVQTTAKDEGDYYRLNGTKVFISNAGLSQFYGVMAKTAPEKGPAGLSMLVVEKGTPGFTIGKVETKMGLRGHPVAELIFDDCLVPKKNLLATEGAGMQIFMAFGGPALLGCGASSIGIARAAFEKAAAYAKERYTFGQPIGKHQAVQMMIFDVAAAIESSRLLLHRTALGFERGLMNPPDLFMAKMLATEMAIDVTYKAMQIHGGYGYSTEYPLERHFRDARAHTLHMQTPEIARTLGASIMLGFGPPGSEH